MSAANWISLCIEITTLIQLVMLTKKIRAGWLVGLSCQVLWLAYCLVTANWPFLVGVFVFGYIDVLGYKNWDREQFK